jgi:hypothetical protein
VSDRTWLLELDDTVQPLDLARSAPGWSPAREKQQREAEIARAERAQIEARDGERQARIREEQERDERFRELAWAAEWRDQRLLQAHAVRNGRVAFAHATGSEGGRFYELDRPGLVPIHVWVPDDVAAEVRAEAGATRRESRPLTGVAADLAFAASAVALVTGGEVVHRAPDLRERSTEQRLRELERRLERAEGAGSSFSPRPPFGGAFGGGTF